MTFEQSTERSSARQKSYANRTPFSGAAFFKFPVGLYDGGYAAKMSSSEIVRYCTLVRVSNFNYGGDIPLTARELFLLDGIAPRTARHVHAKLRERGLIRRSETDHRTIVLVHPWQWPELDGTKPRFQRLPSGKLICTSQPQRNQ
jgi:hypothetical protein